MDKTEVALSLLRSVNLVRPFYLCEQTVVLVVKRHYISVGQWFIRTLCQCL